MPQEQYDYITFTKPWQRYQVDDSIRRPKELCDYLIKQGRAKRYNPVRKDEGQAKAK